MQQIHRALLEQAAGTWPLIFEKGLKRIQTCDHNVNGKTFLEVVEFRDAPVRQKVYNIAALFDDVELIRQLPILTEEWSPCRLPDKCGKSVVDFLFDQLDYDTQIIQGVLHKKFDRLAIPIRLEVVCRILSIKDDDEIRQCILSAGIVGDARMLFVSNLSTESVQWLLDQGVNCYHFTLRQLWGTDRFEEAAKTRKDQLCNFADCGVEVVLELATRFPKWNKSGTLAKFIIDGDEAAVNTLWEDHFEDMTTCTGWFDLNAIKWIVSLCNQRQLECLQQKWRYRDFEVAKYLHAREFAVISFVKGLTFTKEGSLFEPMNNIQLTSTEVSIATLDELLTLGYRCTILPYRLYEVPIIQWVAEHSGLPDKIFIEPPNNQQQLEWVRSHYTFKGIGNGWKIK